MGKCGASQLALFFFCQLIRVPIVEGMFRIFCITGCLLKLLAVGKLLKDLLELRGCILTGGIVLAVSKFVRLVISLSSCLSFLNKENYRKFYN